MSALPASLEISPQATPATTVTVPGSKSVSNRALLTAALADGESRLRDLLDADDTRVMIDSLQRLGVPVQRDGADAVVGGQAGPLRARAAEVDAGLSGTTMRFLLPVLAASTGRFRLTGRGSLLNRPLQDQLDALRQLGADVVSEADDGCPPVLLNAGGLSGGEVSVSGELSSQYLSGLLLAAPLASNETVIEVTGELQSAPFVLITLAVMESFGISVEREGFHRFRVAPGAYRAQDFRVEGDATAAGNFWVAAAVTGGTVKVANVGRASSQGDTRLAEVLEQMGCMVSWTADSCTVQGPPRGELSGGEFDLNDIPDQALALAVAGLFTDSPLTITNVYNMRIKETDRIAAVATELRRIGAVVEEGRDWLRVVPQASYRPARIATYDDHRMAMAFAVAGLVLPGITILDPGCVAKTYPGYFSDFARLQADAGVVL